MLFVSEDYCTMKSISGEALERRDEIAAGINLEKTYAIGLSGHSM